MEGHIGGGHGRNTAIGAARDGAERAAVADFQVYEGGFYDLAHSAGLEARQVRGLRDAGIELAQRVAANGQPASAADLARVFDKSGIPASARPKIIAFWRTVEGKPA
jgi:hypothetical protein